jgi:hypothetical protein
MGNGIRSNLELIERLRRKNAAFFEGEESGTAANEPVNISIRTEETLQKEENLPKSHENHVEHYPEEVKVPGETDKKEKIEVKNILAKIKNINIEELKEEVDEEEPSEPIKGER